MSFAGNISHVYNSQDLPFSDLKDIFLRLFEGRLEYTEKFDGTNIYFSVDPSTRSLLYCRNKDDFHNRGVVFSEFIERYRGTSSEEVFSEFNLNVAALVEGMCENELSVAFGGGTFYNTEILHPAFDSIVKYNTFKVIIQPTGHRSHINESIELSKTLGILKKYEGDFFLINNIRTSETSVNEKLDETMDSLRLLLRGEGLKLSSTIGDFVGKRMLEIASRLEIPPFKQKMLAKRLAGRKGVRLNKIYSGQPPERVAEIRNLVGRKNNLLREVVAPIREIVDKAYGLFLEGFNPSIQTEGDLKSEGIVFSYNDRLYKMTGKYADLIREKNRVEKNKNRIALIPGSFKPPHKGHLQMFEHYAATCDKVYVIVGNNPRKCSEGREYTIQQTQQVLREFLKHRSLGNVVFVADDHPHKKTISILNDPSVVTPGSVVLIGSSNKGDDHGKGAYMYADRGDIKLLNTEETNYSMKENLSSTDLREYISKGLSDKVWYFIPEGVEHNRYMEIFGLNETSEKKTTESTSPSSLLDETSVSGNVQGHAGGKKGPWVKREEFIDEIKLRKGIRNVIENISKQQELKEQRLRKIISHLLKEKLSPPPTESTGINVLRGTLKSIITQLEDGYNGLTTEPEQRQSFRSHILVSVENLLAPIEASEQGAEEGGALAQEEVQVDIGDKPEDDPNFISIEDEPEEPEEEKPEDKFVELPDEDPTGRNIAKTTFKGIAPQIANSYEQLGNQKDQDTFYEYLLTNLKLYFDKFEDAMAINVEEPTSPSYDEEIEVVDA